MLSYLVSLSLKLSDWEFDQAVLFATFQKFGIEISSTHWIRDRKRSFLPVRMIVRPIKSCAWCLFSAIHDIPTSLCLYYPRFSKKKSFKITPDTIEWARSFSLGHRVVSPAGSSPRSIRPMCICHSLNLRIRSKHGKTVTAHVESKLN